LSFPEISAAEAKALLAREKPPRLIDVREPEEWAICQLPGAELLPLSVWPEVTAQKLTDPDQPLLVYCHHGVRSGHATAFLRQRGFSDVTNLAGGIDAWAREVDQSVPRY
jgi:rhodanese-related sulfurtransferase